MRKGVWALFVPGPFVVVVSGFSVVAATHGTRGLSSLTRDRSCVPCSESAEFNIGPPGKSLGMFCILGRRKQRTYFQMKLYHLSKIDHLLGGKHREGKKSWFLGTAFPTWVTRTFFPLNVTFDGP